MVVGGREEGTRVESVEAQSRDTMGVGAGIARSRDYGAQSCLAGGGRGEGGSCQVP